MNDDELLQHYILYGHKENRKYKLDIPDDFDPLVYRELNGDLHNLSELELKIHYTAYKDIENRLYKI